jgi:hypothetical protein
MVADSDEEGLLVDSGPEGGQDRRRCTLRRYLGNRECRPRFRAPFPFVGDNERSHLRFRLLQSRCQDDIGRRKRAERFLGDLPNSHHPIKGIGAV